MRFHGPVVVLSFLLFNTVTWAQNRSLAIDVSKRPEAPAVFLENAPEIDGIIEGDVVWQGVPAFGEMIQVMPAFGNPSSEKTEIRIGYTNTHFYLGVICHDSQPDKFVVTDARRDANLESMDAFLFILDTYHDGQNGFVFGTNTVGIQYDGQVDNEGQGNFNQNRQQGGVIGGFNLNWDTSWEVETEVSPYGWSAEFAIPLKTLRFATGDNVTWGINFQRNIQKSNEVSYWASLPLAFNLYRLSVAGDLTGLNLRSPGNLKVIPYALGNVSRDFTAEPSETNLDFEFGGDVKYSITPAVTLDLTYNTDFAQVEVDDQQVNLDRFNLFFPEKRPFFLENAGLFTVGSPGEVDLFFSRRVGIGQSGQIVPIIGGARLSGKINQTNIGFINMYTDDVSDDGITKNAFTIARVNHQFKGRSSIGGAFINRSGISSFDDDHNSTFALDGNLGIGEKARLSGYVAKSSTPGIDSDDHSFQLSARYLWDGWRISGSYTEVGGGFNPEVGFLLRSEFRKVEGLVFKTIRAPESSPFLENRPHVSYRGYWNFAGFQETGFLHIDNHWVWKSLTELHTGLNLTREGVVRDFEISGGVTVPAGTYDHAEAQIVFFTNPNKPFSYSSRFVIGGFFGGDRISANQSINVRVGDKFSSEWGLGHNTINLPGGDFSTNIFRSRIAYTFTPTIYLQALVQYNSVIDSWSSNIRFGWLQTSNTGLFLVYNEGRRMDSLESRSFIVKYTMLFDVIK